MLLKRLKRWLGWDGDSGLLDFADLGDRPRPIVTRPAVRTMTKTKPGEPPQPAERRAKLERNPLDVLDNPRLSLDKPVDDGRNRFQELKKSSSTSNGSLKLSLSMR
jgi:hypothetical protein